MSLRCFNRWVAALGILGVVAIMAGSKPALSDQILLVPNNDGRTGTGGRITAFDGGTGADLGLFVPPDESLIQAIALGPDNLLYASRWINSHSSEPKSQQIDRYDLQGNFVDTFISSETSPLSYPIEMTFGPDGNFYVTGDGPRLDTILRFDGKTGAFIDIFAEGLIVPQDLVFGPDGNLYVTNGLADISSVFRFDGQTGAFIDEFVESRSGGLYGAAGLTFGPDGHLYVAGFASEDILKYDGLTGEFLEEFVADGLTVPTDLIFGPDGNLYVSSRFPEQPGTGGSAGGILRFDGDTGEFIDQFVTPGAGGLGLPKRGFFFVDAPEFVAVPEPPTIAMTALGFLIIAGFSVARRDRRSRS